MDSRYRNRSTSTPFRSHSSPHRAHPHQQPDGSGRPRDELLSSPFNSIFNQGNNSNSNLPNMSMTMNPYHFLQPGAFDSSLIPTLAQLLPPTILAQAAVHSAQQLQLQAQAQAQGHSRYSQRPPEINPEQERGRGGTGVAMAGNRKEESRDEWEGKDRDNGWVPKRRWSDADSNEDQTVFATPHQHHPNYPSRQRHQSPASSLRSSRTFNFNSASERNYHPRQTPYQSPPQTPPEGPDAPPRTYSRSQQQYPGWRKRDVTPKLIQQDPKLRQVEAWVESGDRGKERRATRGDESPRSSEEEDYSDRHERERSARTEKPHWKRSRTESDEWVDYEESQSQKRERKRQRHEREVEREREEREREQRHRDDGVGFGWNADHECFEADKHNAPSYSSTTVVVATPPTAPAVMRALQRKKLHHVVRGGGGGGGGGDVGVGKNVKPQRTNNYYPIWSSGKPPSIFGVRHFYPREGRPVIPTLILIPIPPNLSTKPYIFGHVPTFLAPTRITDEEGRNFDLPKSHNSFWKEELNSEGLSWDSPLMRVGRSREVREEDLEEGVEC